MSTLEVAATAVVLMVKFADVDPTGTSTDAGTVAALPDEDRFTVPPLLLDMVTVPVREVPPPTELAERERPVRIAAAGSSLWPLMIIENACDPEGARPAPLWVTVIV